MLFRILPLVVTLVMFVLVSAGCSAAEFKGRYCEGNGDAEFLRLIDRSFEFFHPSADVPNISMLYKSDWDSLIEGPNWEAWWSQNSYGTTLCALPFLQEPWLSFLQHAQDFWFKWQGDGKSTDNFEQWRAADVPKVIAPDGCLVDCASPTGAFHRQGDCAWSMHDWGFEFTAAAVLMQAEALLISRDATAIRKYLPNLERACEFIETRRDLKNGLFLVGAAANLLAPSYAGSRNPDGTFGHAYLSGLSITYLGTLERMVELYKLTGDKAKQELYESRRETTRKSLPQLLTEDGYFVKYIEPDGTKQGVFGKEKFGYFEGVANVDAIALRAVDHAQAEKIYWRIKSIPELRPYDYLITNYPGLDDTYQHWGTREAGHLWEFGRWVNGGVWSTVEARAIMAYYRLGKFEDIRKVNRRSMRLADTFQMDAPLTEFGNQVWFTDKLTNLCYDALGIPAATIRGLFEYVYSADAVTLYPHVPPSITHYRQKEPIRFGDKRIAVSIRNGGPIVKSVRVNGEEWKVDSPERVTLRHDALPRHAEVEIVTTGGSYVPATRQVAPEPAAFAVKPGELPEALRKPCEELKAIDRERLSPELRPFLDEALAAFDAYRERAARDAAGAYPTFSAEKRAAVLKMYEDAALGLHRGLVARRKQN